MASADRSTARSLVNDLIEHSKSYSFFQAVKLLTDYQKLLATDEGRTELKHTLIHYSVNPDLSHHHCDIDSIQIQEKEKIIHARIDINFMGLYGAASPLPVFYTEAILQAEEGDDHTRAFMDLFNHRLISLVYYCWEKYRYYLQYRQGNSDAFSNWMFALSGLYQTGTETTIRAKTDIIWERLLPFTAMLGMRCHSASVIEAVLRAYFEWDAIHIESNILRYIEIENDQKNRLGMQCATLGDDLLLGSYVEDRSGKFRIIISHLSYQLFCQFLPDGSLNQTLKKLVNFILRDQLDYDIELRLLNPEIPQLILGIDSHEKLGYTTWVGEHNNTQQSVLIPGR